MIHTVTVIADNGQNGSLPALGDINKALRQSCPQGEDKVKIQNTSKGSGEVTVTFTGLVDHDSFPSNLRAVTRIKGKAPWSVKWGSSPALLSSEAGVGTAGTGYSIIIHNESTLNDSQAIVFQKQPTLPAEVVSLAWLSKTCHAHTQVTYNWTLNFDFVWGQNGKLAPGVSYEAGGTVPADLTNNNEVTLSYVDNGFEFGATSQGPKTGALLIHEDTTVPGQGNTDQGAVGIGMYGKGTFVRPTQPTGSAGGLEFVVHPQYWVAMGTYQEGEVVDESALYYPQLVSFPAGEFHATCVFTGTGWEISYS